MKPTEIVAEKIVRRLLHAEDYRIEMIALINAESLQYTIDFFKRVVDAKFNDQGITLDWYKANLLDPSLSSEELIIHSGLNKKTVSNMYQSARRDIVLEVTEHHYDVLLETINALIQADHDIEVQLTIRFKNVSIDLNLSESLIVINTLAVKRAQLRGGLWSTAGKQVEAPLMLTLSKLFGVPNTHYRLRGLSKQSREVDFHFLDSQGRVDNCEVKLMGKGNPESADAIFARDTKIFSADTLSALNKEQLEHNGTYWIELRSDNGYQKLMTVFEECGIPYHPFDGNLAVLDTIIPQVFTEINPARGETAL